MICAAPFTHLKIGVIQFIQFSLHFFLKIYLLWLLLLLNYFNYCSAYILCTYFVIHIYCICIWKTLTNFLVLAQFFLGFFFDCFFLQDICICVLSNSYLYEKKSVSFHCFSFIYFVFLHENVTTIFFYYLAIYMYIYIFIHFYNYA